MTYKEKMAEIVLGMARSAMQSAYNDIESEIEQSEKRLIAHQTCLDFRSDRARSISHSLKNGLAHLPEQECIFYYANFFCVKRDCKKSSFEAQGKTEQEALDKAIYAWNA